jgi:hypothetical protein
MNGVDQTKILYIYIKKYHHEKSYKTNRRRFNQNY